MTHYQFQELIQTLTCRFKVKDKATTTAAHLQVLLTTGVVMETEAELINKVETTTELVLVCVEEDKSWLEEAIMKSRTSDEEPNSSELLIK